MDMNFNHGKELSSIDFESMIGGPLCAVIKAQNQAALLTTTFIREFGFQKNGNNGGASADPIMVEFTYDKPGLFGMPTKTKLKVPFLTMIPIPSLRIEEVHIEFLAKITSMQSVQIETNDVSMTMNQSSQTNTSENENSSSGRSWWSTNRWQDKNKSTSNSTASMMTAATSQRQTKTGATITKDFSLKVVVRAVQDELPAGLDRILSILEGQIKEDNGADLMSKMLGNMGGGAMGGIPGVAPQAGASQPAAAQGTQ